MPAFLLSINTCEMEIISFTSPCMCCLALKVTTLSAKLDIVFPTFHDRYSRATLTFSILEWNTCQSLVISKTLMYLKRSIQRITNRDGCAVKEQSLSSLFIRCTREFINYWNINAIKCTRKHKYSTVQFILKTKWMMWFQRAALSICLQFKQNLT